LIFFSSYYHITKHATRTLTAG